MSRIRVYSPEDGELDGRVVITVDDHYVGDISPSEADELADKMRDAASFAVLAPVRALDRERGEIA